MKHRYAEPRRQAAVGARLREEASRSRVDPPPYLVTRIMAEVSATPRIPTDRHPWRWAAVAAGTVALVGLAAFGIHRLLPRQSGALAARPASPGAPVLSAAAVPLPDAWPAMVQDPFGGEVDALAADARRATRFLAACIPL